MQTSLAFFVNGCKIVEEHPDPEWTLAYYLRTKLSLRGTKISCGEGECGLCTVMVSKYDHNTKSAKHYSVKSCLVLVVSLNGCAVTTVEGLGSLHKGLHPVQERLAKRHGAQCGFCSPGFVMAMYSLLRNNPKPSKEDIATAIEGNYCRCTGYRPILEAFYSFSEDKCPCGFQGECCQSKTPAKESLLSQWEHLRPYDATQDPIFPPVLTTLANQDLMYKGKRVTWYAPTTLQGLLKLMQTNPGAKVIGKGALTGSNDRLSSQPHPILISVQDVEELRQFKATPEQVCIGSSLTISEFECNMKKIENACQKNRNVVHLFVEMFPYLGSVQLRNLASFMGNVASGWFISDLNICFLVTHSDLMVQNDHGQQRVAKIDNKFFTGCGKVQLAANEIVTAVSIPLQQNADETHEFFFAKQGKRHGHDNAIVNSACRFTIDKKNFVISDACFAFGGIADRPHMVQVVLDSGKGDLKGNKTSVWEHIMKFVEHDLESAVDKKHDMQNYRITLALSFVYKFLISLDQKLAGQAKTMTDHVPYEPVEALQYVPEVVSGQPVADPVGRPIMHDSVERHTTGQSMYCDDTPSQPNELHLAMVLSDRAHATVKSVDTSEACKIPGVVCWVDVNDIPPKGSNTPGLPIHDTPIFVNGTVNSPGEFIGGIVAESPILARRASRLVKVVYEDLPPVLTIEEACEKNQFFEPHYKHTKGDIERGFAESDHVTTGQVRVNGQEHFYLEPNGCIVTPKDGNEYDILAATQGPGWLQGEARGCLGVPLHKITSRVKRLGGAFGGKSFQCYVAAWPALIAAYKLQKPIRHILTQPEDIASTGKRPDFLAKYKVGYTKDMAIKAMQITVYMNAGCTVEFSHFLNHHCVANIDNGYNIPNMDLQGILCRTNIHANTAFRGAGQPEGHLLMEEIMEQVAQAMKVDAVQLRKKHLYKDGDVTLHGFPLSNCTLERCWEECIRMSQYEARVTEVDTFNRQNRYKKRGISVTSVKFGLGDLDSPFEQGSCLVNIYLDGTVLVSHGGVEMGQGLNTKVLQVASRVLKIPVENITSSENSTEKVPNSIPTGGSIGTDVHCLAVKDACEILMNRLEPYMHKNPKGNFFEWVMAAHNDRVCLSATGFAQPKGENPDGKRGGKPRYFVYGACCSEAEIDCLTGDHYLIQCDMILDIGQSINPALDVGQIEGGFMQGYGLVAMEELKRNASGKLLTGSAFSYKIPTISNVPKKFRVAILKDGFCRDNVYSSKGIGEPPLTLGVCGLFAIINAVKAARQEAGINEPFHIDPPATPDVIRLACPKLKC